MVIFAILDLMYKLNMELGLHNIKYEKNFDGETLTMFVSNNQEPLGIIQIEKELIDFEDIDFDKVDLDSLLKTVEKDPSYYSQKEPFSQTIMIETFSKKDQLTDSIKTIQNDHNNVLAQISDYLSTLTGIKPTFTRNDDQDDIATSVDFSARVSTDYDIIKRVIENLNMKNIGYEEEIKSFHR